MITAQTMIPKKALLGLHVPGVEKSFARILRLSGYEVQCTADLEDMLAHCRQQKYDLYLMDLNFGIPGSRDIAPSRQVYGALQQQGVEDLAAKFYGISGNIQTVESAQKEGIPAIINTDLPDLLRERFKHG